MALAVETLVTFVVAAVAGGAIALGGAAVAVRLVRRSPPKLPPRPVTLLDTSTIIDGRIADVAEAGFVDGALLVPGFVLRELQHLADGADPLRRNRGKRGFEVLERLRRAPHVTLEIDDTDVPGLREVDDKLVRRARALGARVLTNDQGKRCIGQTVDVVVTTVLQTAAGRMVFTRLGEEPTGPRNG